ncbi:MAG: FtsX-like permease family protein [Ruminococcaceae bacterium]|nr:FtsX-like permease family protein [Oscillospiraceae bacterium]
MTFKYGIRSTLRAKGRSILFALLIAVICLALTLGAGMWFYCSQQLEILDESYTSVALLEYMGADYPNADAADSYARAAAAELDTQALEELEGVDFWEENKRKIGYIDGYVPGGDAPYEDYALVEFTQFSENTTLGTVYFTEEEMAAPYIAINATNNTAKLCTETVSSDWVPYFIESEGKYLQQDFETGVYTEFTEEELPTYNICSKHHYYKGTDTWGGTVAYYYEIVDYFVYSDGEYGHVITSRQESFYGRYIPNQLICKTYTYDPATGLYGGEGKVVAGYSAISNNVLYSRNSAEKTNKYTAIEIGDSGFVAERGRRYTLHGKYVLSDTGNDFKFLITDFYEGCPIVPYQDTTTEEPAPIFEEYAALYANANNNVAIEASDDIASLELFHQNVFRLEQGRFPNAGERSVCVVSGDIARQLELQLGDIVSLELFDSAADSRFLLSATGDIRALEIVGITNRVDGYYGNVWISAAEGDFEEELFGYQLGRVGLDNASAAETVEAIQALCPDGVRVTLFDQGYAAAARPIETMLNVASAVSVVSALGALVVIFLFAYLFVGRQRESVNVLVSLGTPGGKINLWLLSGAVLISGISSALGALAGNFALGRLIELAINAASSMYVVDSRFSESAVGIVREAVSQGSASSLPALVAFIFVFILSLIFCWIFLAIARKTTAPKRGKLSVRLPRGKSSCGGRGALRFAFLSARRGGWRSTVVPIVALVLSLFLGILASASSAWEEQMDSLYRDAEITGRVVSLNGRSSSNLTVSADAARSIWKSGDIESVGMALGFNYWLSEEIPDFKGLFAEENRSNWISVQPDIVALNTLSAAPEFIHSRKPDVEWLKGWDESFLADPDACSSLAETMSFREEGTILNAEKSADTVACIAPKAFLESHGLSLGDEFEANLTMSFNSEMIEHSRVFKIVGFFTQLGEDANLYVPLSLWCDESWITGEEDIAGKEQQDSSISSVESRNQHFYRATRFSTLIFSLSSASRLESMRDFLTDSGFSQVGKTGSDRTTVLLYDRSFVETVSGLNRYISFSQLLFPALFVLVALLGFIISWLMVSSRRMEFAILRGLGASKSRVFFSFFLEQALLCLTGSVLGSVLLLFAASPVTWLPSVAIFILCYFLGAALSVAVVGRTHLMSLLSERE